MKGGVLPDFGIISPRIFHSALRSERKTFECTKATKIASTLDGVVDSLNLSLVSSTVPWSLGSLTPFPATNGRLASLRLRALSLHHLCQMNSMGGRMKTLIGVHGLFAIGVSVRTHVMRSLSDHFSLRRSSLVE